MIDIEALYQAFLEMYHSGMSQQQIAKQTGVAQSYIANLISGKRKFDGLTLRKVQKLFPGATISIGNRSIGDHNVVHPNARVQSDNNFLSDDRTAVEKFRSELIDKIIGSDEITDEERGRVLRIIRSAK